MKITVINKNFFYAIKEEFIRELEFRRTLHGKFEIVEHIRCKGDEDESILIVIRPNLKYWLPIGSEASEFS